MLPAVLSGFAAALVASWLHRLERETAGWIIALLPAGLFLYFSGFIEIIAAGDTVAVSYAWVPTMGINLSFYADGLSLLFVLLISGIGTLVLIYSGGYLKGHPQLGRFYSFILIFMASMLGLVLADNAITLFVFWELTSLSSYLLIGFDHKREGARFAALQALLVTALGGLALLAGLLLLGQAGGSLELSVLLSRGELVRAHPLYTPILFLILAGAFTKSAQFPFHFWLPNAMEAPTPVSAYLHSATMVKAGVYLLARLHPILGGTDIWMYVVTGVGAATMLVGACLALRQTDLKRILAYSTVSALGILTLFLGLGTPAAIKAAVVFLLGHALYKGALFLVAGAVDHETGARDVDRLGGLRQAMPITAAAGGLAALSMAGLPPLFGFIGKEMLYEAAYGSLGAALPLTSAVVLASMIFVAVAGMTGFGPFTGKKTSTPKHPHEAVMSLWLGPMLLGLSGLLLGLLPASVGNSLLSPAIEAVSGQAGDLELTLWHGLNPTIALSAVTLAGGAGLYAGREALRRAASRLQMTSWWGPARWYSLLLDGLNVLARGQTRLLQSGYLRYYLLIIIATALGLAGPKLASLGGPPGLVSWQEVRFYEWSLAALILLAALVAIRSRSRLGAVAALGVVGYGVALVYVLFGAPDLAMTQFMVETLTVILFVLVFYHLPRFARLSSGLVRARDALVAVTAGALITTIILFSSNVQFHPKISGYFAEHSLPLAHGRNIVNVILVDFRGLDTLGEITVLAVAAVGVYALLKLRLREEKSK
ncbi:MAG: putative monovalent cation/H+ antiporter subunit A [Deltaproteobacteria bacterium]|nr:putative monovalent cation/H+ antiporter subunit A [Deltaproteobacteria bacterium]MBI2991735.1 putative monovalent cation/H+ antiporter subunit A [Deltaproteobacteria bacterium]MBI3060578.1 putative monovalent cation/H+ antiporter subunit A [Deltaproteobacteria bacterium]